MERALIDWHDFVVVETITFDEDEMKPAAARPAQAGAERAAVKREEKEDDMDMDVEMEMDLDDQEIRIVKGEAPRPTPSVGTSEALKYSICPKCGEKIPLDEMEEHMRIELLDPIARQKKLEQMKRRRESSLAEGDEISKNLRNLSALRPDIFDEEEEARKAEENRRLQPKIIWDGHTGSIAATASAVMAGMTPEEKAKALAKAEADRGPRIGPAVSTTQPAAPAPGAPGQQPPGPPGQPLLPNPTHLPPGAGAPGQPPRPHMPPGMQPPGMPPMGTSIRHPLPLLLLLSSYRLRHCRRFRAHRLCLSRSL
jgi:splicing factor 3A subunit 1